MQSLKLLSLINLKGDFMAKFGCSCGETLSNSKCPNNIQYYVFSDPEWDEIIGMRSIENTLDIPDPKYDVWKCPNCERIHIFDGTKLLVTYVIERDERKKEDKR